MSNIKKKQHYVWKNYLRPWTENNKIWCLRQGEKFCTSPDNIALQRFFYQAEPLNLNELEYIKGILNVLHPTSIEPLSGMLKMYNISSAGDEYLVKCGVEDFHGIIERKFIPLLQKLYLNDLSFLENEDDRNTFSFFIGCQYCRTNKMRQNLNSSNLPLQSHLNKEKIASVLQLIFADLLGNWVYSKAKISIIINNSGYQFITGDQPVVNMKPEFNSSIPTSLELYYPITTTLALFISENPSEKITLTKKEQIDSYNKFIYENSKEQIYAKEKESLNLI